MKLTKKIRRALDGGYAVEVDQNGGQILSFASLNTVELCKEGPSLKLFFDWAVKFDPHTQAPAEEMKAYMLQVAADEARISALGEGLHLIALPRFNTRYTIFSSGVDLPNVCQRYLDCGL